METYSFSLAPYCEGCREFNADVRELAVNGESIHIIGCEKEKICRNIYKFITKKEIKEHGQ